jgi:hypothetical protein
MPTFFVIGASKCGTSSLHDYLSIHPEIAMSRLKEPAYFVPERIYRNQVIDRQDYLALFETGAQQRGESSVSYSWWPIRKGVPRAIAAQVPEAKFVYLVRDPIERARSHYVEAQTSRMPYSRRHFRGSRSARALVDLDPTWNPLTAVGMYMTQIKRYLEFFPKNSILVVESERLRSEKDLVLDEICAFVGVGSMPRDPRLALEANTAESKRQESELYVRLTESTQLRRVMDLAPRGIRKRVISGIRRGVSQPIRKPLLAESTRAMFEDLFRPEVEQLREFTGESFAGWSI